MAKGKAHSDETRAAVIAALLAGQGVNDVAREFGLDSGLVSRWKKTIPEKDLQQVTATKKERLVDLVEGHLIASFKAAIALAEQANDIGWRNKQSAADIAVFYGVISDKAFKLVEIAGRVFANGAQDDSKQLP